MATRKKSTGTGKRNRLTWYNWPVYRPKTRKKGKYGRTRNPSLVDAWTNTRTGGTASNNNKLAYSIGMNRSMTKTTMECDRDWWWFGAVIIKTLLLLPTALVLCFYGFWLIGLIPILKIIKLFKSSPFIPAEMKVIPLSDSRNWDYKDPQNKYGPNYNPRLMPKGPGWKWW
jgi:hypothetical protein